MAALFMAGGIAAATAAQAPGTIESANSPSPEIKHYSVPTNLKVLPQDATGQQVHEIMEQWSAELGTHCDSCHAEDPNKNGPNGRSQLDFASDSKGMKSAARLMYTMTEKINSDFVAKIDSSGIPVTCGTCHRGRLGPDPFVIAPKNGSFAPQDSLSSGETNLPTQGKAHQ